MNTTYVEKYILFIVCIIENNKSIIIIQELNNALHQHCCALQGHISDSQNDNKTFFYVLNNLKVSSADQNDCLQP
jgi:hypothetical protein